MPTPQDAERHHTVRAAWAIAPAVIIAGVGGGMAFPILPSVGLASGLSLPFIGTILAANRLGRVVANPWVGAAVDRFGGRAVLTAGVLAQIVVFALYMLGVWTGCPGPCFLVGRLLHGPTSACVFIGSQTLALHLGSGPHRGLATSIVSSALAAGTPVGLVVGGILAGYIGPLGAFAVAALMPPVAAWAAWRFVPRIVAPAHTRLSLSVAVWSMVDGRIAAIAAANFVTNFAANGIVLATLSFVVAHRQIVLGGVPHQAITGCLMGLLIVATLFVTPVVGRLSDRTGKRARIAATGFALMGTGLICLRQAHSSQLMAAGLAAVGAGGAAVAVPLLSLLGDTVAADRRGSTLGGLQLFSDLGGTLGPVVGTAYLTTSDTAAYTLAAVLTVGMLPIMLGLARRERSLEADLRPA
jgi:MFS family permease